MRLPLAALWLLASAILLFIARDHIASLTMWDPDDYLRLQQVRDWLGGQSVFDVTQYRIDPPGGVAMHWSRIVDLPLAAIVLLLQPMFGAGIAERIAASAMPLITFGGALTAIALLAARLAGVRAALIAAMLATTAPLILFHMLPLRIDHHGWQTMCGLFAVAACFDRDARRGGLVAGFVTALWLAISLEAMPMAAAIAALLGARWLFAGEGPRFRGFCAALGLGGLLLFAGSHSRAAWDQPWCDAMSPAWFGPLIAAPLAMALLVRATAARGPYWRIGALALAGAIGVALPAHGAPACLAGPFGKLDPLVRHYWYDNVLEGLPVWKQPASNAMLLLGFPVIGFAGTILAWRRATDAAVRRDWLAMLFLLSAAFALSLLVQRAGGFAHALALPGAGAMLAALLGRIGGWRHPLARILATVTALFLLSPIGAMTIGSALLPASGQGDVAGATQRGGAPCPACIAKLAAMKPAYILAGLDLTPPLLIATPHRFAGSGHHRDNAAIHRVIVAFIGTPDVARRIMAARGMDYVLIDPEAGESDIYAKAGPNGLMAMLVRGRAPGWLEPVPLGDGRLRMWRRVN